MQGRTAILILGIDIRHLLDNTFRAVDYGPVQQQVQQWSEKFCSADLAPADEDVGTNSGEDSTAARQARMLWMEVRNDRPLLFDATDFSVYTINQFPPHHNQSSHFPSNTSP